MRTPDRVCQHVTLHLPFTPETKDSIDEGLLMKMPKDATLINAACPVLSARPDFCHISDAPCEGAEEVRALTGDRFMKRASCQQEEK